MTIQIPLTQGQVAIVCDCHAHLVIGYKWAAVWDAHSKSFRAVRSGTKDERASGKPSAIYMHVVINQTPSGLKTDHKDGNTLNNQCFNLRNATTSQNACNKGVRANSKSGYKGVYERSKTRWEAGIRINGQHHRLGAFSNPIDAAKAYDDAARKYHGEFARTNFGQQEN